MRVVTASRWNSALILGVSGTPADRMPTPDDELTAEDIEASDMPHDFDQSEVEPDEPDAPRAKRAKRGSAAE